jgi:hypothetical protein
MSYQPLLSMLGISTESVRPAGARIGRLTDAPLILLGLASGCGVLAGPGPAGGAADRVACDRCGEGKAVEALLEILEAVFEGIFEWRKDRAERGDSAQETVVLGGQPDGDPYSYQLGGRPQPRRSQGTSSRRGIRQ